MSNKISRRTFLKCTGASAAALGAAAMLGGCGSSTSNAIEVKVGSVGHGKDTGELDTQIVPVADLVADLDFDGVAGARHRCEPLRRYHV